MELAPNYFGVDIKSLIYLAPHSKRGKKCDNAVFKIILFLTFFLFDVQITSDDDLGSTLNYFGVGITQKN